MTLSDEQREVLKLAIEIYGVGNQVDKCIEEMSELTKALLKHRQDPNVNTWSDVVEEIADVIIMCEQMGMIYGEQIVPESKGVKGSIEKKIKRLARRLHEEV